MKKILAISLLVSLLVVGGCGKHVSEERKTDEVKYSVGETISLADYDITITKVTQGNSLHFIDINGSYASQSIYAKDSEFGMAGDKNDIENPLNPTNEGNVYIAYEMKVKFTGKESPTSGLTGSDFKLNYGEGYKFEDSGFFTKQDDGSWYYCLRPSYTVMSDKETIFRVYYEVPESIISNNDDLYITTLYNKMLGDSGEVRIDLR